MSGSVAQNTYISSKHQIASGIITSAHGAFTKQTMTSGENDIIIVKDSNLHMANINCQLVSTLARTYYLGATQRARGVTPTDSGAWASAPTTLANATDDDIATGFGAGGTSTAATDDTDFVVVDLGAIYTGLLVCFAQYHNDAGGTTGNFKIKTSTDGTTWTERLTDSHTGDVNVQTLKVVTPNISVRYIRYIYYTGGAGGIKVTNDEQMICFFDDESSVTTVADTPAAMNVNTTVIGEHTFCVCSDDTANAPDLYYLPEADGV